MADRQADPAAQPARGPLWFLGRLPRYLRPYRRLAVLIVLALAVDVAYESLFPLSIKFLIDDAIVPQDGRLLVLIVAGLVGMLLLWAASTIVHDHLFARLASNVLSDLRREMYDRLQQLSMSFYARTPGAEILARFSTDLAAVENALVMALPYGLLSFGCAVAATGVMFVLDWRIALLSVLGIGLCLVGPKIIGPRASEAGVRMKSLQAGVSGMIQEHVSAQPVVKAFGLQALLAGRFGERLGELRQDMHRSSFLSYLLERTPKIGIMVFNLAVVAVGAWLAFEGSLSVGSLVAFQTMFMSLSQSVAGLAWVAPHLVQAAAGMQRIEELLSEAPEVVDAPGAADVAGGAGALALQDVSFGYGSQRNLDGVSLEIPAGASVAFVGPSGSGKSTALNLIIRFYDPLSGSVMLDGRDYRSITQSSLRALTGVVFQENFLFNTTIRENIRLGRPGASEAEVEAAAKLAEIHDVVMAMPQAYETQVGERGGRLSGGQRQRIAIARALLRDPRILILDEATSALDPATEASINATLARVGRGRTSVSVTHRLDSVTAADRIFVLERGRLVEQGTHAELLAAGGVYRELWEHQHGLTLSPDGDTAAVDPARLRRVPILDRLDEHLLQKVARSFVTEHYPEDRLVVREGDSGNRFYIIVRGTLGVWLTMEDGTERRIRILRDGDHFGDVALLRDVPRTATVRTLAPSVLLSLQRGLFLPLLDESPELREKLERDSVGLEYGTGAARIRAARR